MDPESNAFLTLRAIDGVVGLPRSSPAPPLEIFGAERPQLITPAKSEGSVRAAFFCRGGERGGGHYQVTPPTIVIRVICSSEKFGQQGVLGVG